MQRREPGQLQLVLALPDGSDRSRRRRAGGMITPMSPTLSRRSFLEASAAAGGGLLISFSLPASLAKQLSAPPPPAPPSEFAPNAFIRIDSAGQVTLVMHKVEMGQGTYTAMPMILAEELEADLSQVRLEHAPADDTRYWEPSFVVQETGGSTSVRGNFEPLRRAGATARTMLVAAAVATCPVFGGKVGAVDDTKAKAIPGVRQVVRLDDAVAVVADDTWTAKKGLAALDIRWDEGPNATLSTADIVLQLEAASRKSGVVGRDEGDVAKAMAGAVRRVEAIYEVPFLAHATVEPIKCTVHVPPAACDLWLGTQVPTFTQTAAAKVAGLPKSRVQVHNHYLGGGFGRRLEVDFVIQAVGIAKQVDGGGPVQVLWSREEDIQHDMYRPYYYDRFIAGLDAGGRPVAWTHRIVGSSIEARVISELFPKNLRVMRAGGMHRLGAMIKHLDLDAVEGAAEPPYAIPNIRVDFVRQEPPGVRTAFWRGVGPTHNIFVVESFIDELAAAAKQDPFEYRRALLERSPRAKAVLELAAAQAGWGKPLPPGAGRGISLLHAFGSYIAQVAEVAVSRQGEVRVPRVVCAVDCGTVVNPEIVKAQMESGIIFGMTAALWGEITIKNGRVEQHNFNDYRALRMSEAPAIEVHLVQSGEAPGGVGEPGTSAVMPAITNAIFAATAKRMRKLPVKDQLRPAT